MNRNEFLKKLREALKNSLDKEAVDSKLDYYDKYISDEMAKGRTEKEVLDELGDPNLIAKTIKTVTGTEDVIDAGESANTNESATKKQKKTRSAYTYVGDSRAVIGCAIAFLMFIIIAMTILRFLGVLVIGTMGMAYGIWPILLIAFLIFLFTGRK